MQACRSLLSAVTLVSAMSFGTAAIAADLPNQGDYKGSYAAVGTIKTKCLSGNILNPMNHL